ncbi:3' terminal RNA ribose 2'-O-methyltransferase Hen1 [Candidatus Poribacteria bacterium]
MLLTITSTNSPATDLGYLLHKHPERVQEFKLKSGKAHVFYPEAGVDRCTAALLLGIDPIGLVRGRRRSSGGSFSLQQYVNDRPYVASSFLSVAIAEVFGSALKGQCKDRPELVDTPLPLRAKIAVLPCRGGEVALRRLFEPLGYHVSAQQHVMDEQFPEWGNSPYFTVELENTIRLRDLLTHLYVLVPVMDDDKHYWVGDEEIDKLLRYGEGWLANHPERESITQRYLKHQRRLTRAALAQLTEEDDPDPDAAEAISDEEESSVEAPIRLNEQRLDAVMDALRESGASSVLDLGCGEGKLLRLLLRDKTFTQIVGMDVSYRSLEIATERLRLDELSDRQRERIKLIQGSLMYRDKRLNGYDAAAVVEVIEHLDAARLASFERVIFEFARPGTAIITTPNYEYNVKWTNLPAGKFRHRDHRFEWTRAEFQAWAHRIAQEHDYSVNFLPIGPSDEIAGPPTQMGIFTR